jgi:hypothetical protein
MLHIVLVLLLIPVPGCFPTKLCYTNGGPALLHKLAARSKKPAASRLNSLIWYLSGSRYQND